MTKTIKNNLHLIIANIILWSIVSIMLFLIFSVNKVFAEETQIPSNFFSTLNPWLGSSSGTFRNTTYATWTGYTFKNHKSSVYLDATINSSYNTQIEDNTDLKFILRFGALDNADSTKSTDLIDGFFAMSTFYIIYDNRDAEVCTPSYYSSSSFLIECYISDYHNDLNTFRVFFSLYPESLAFQEKKYDLYVDFKSVDYEWDGTYSQPVSPGGNSNTGIDYSSRFDNLEGAINDINDSINNDDIDTTSASNWFTSFVNEDHGLSSVITAPLNFIRSLSNKTCNTFTINLFNTDYNISCMQTIYRTYFNNFFTIYQIIISGLVSYYILLDLFRMVKGFQNPEEDKIEVVDL